jgi:hypothetical protein
MSGDDKRFDLDQGEWIRLLQRRAEQLPPKDRDALERNLGRMAKCRADRAERRHGKTVLLKGKPCSSVVCLLCRREAVVRVRDDLVHVFGHVPKAELRAVTLKVPGPVQFVDLGTILRDLGEAFAGFVKAGSAWRSCVQQWGGGFRTRWVQKQPGQATVRLSIGLIARLREGPNLETLGGAWRTHLTRGCNVDADEKGDSALIAIGQITNRKTAARWASNYDEPFPRSITKMPSPAFIAYFDRIRELHQVLGRRTFPAFRRAT